MTRRNSNTGSGSSMKSDHTTMPVLSHDILFIILLLTFFLVKKTTKMMESQEIERDRAYRTRGVGAGFFNVK